MDNGSYHSLKTPLALFIAGVLALPAYAADWTIPDNNNDVLVINGSGWNDNAIIGDGAEGDLTIKTNSIWAGNAQVGTNSVFSVVIDNNSSWNGNVDGNGLSGSKAGVTLENSDWTGQADGLNFLAIEGDNSEVNANINMNSPGGSLDLILENGSRYSGDIFIAKNAAATWPTLMDLQLDNSEWVSGSLTADYTDIDIMLGDSIANFSADLTNTDIDIALEGDSVWNGNIVSFTDYASDSEHNITIEGDSQWNGNIESHLDATSGGSHQNSVDIIDGGKWIGNITITSANSASAINSEAEVSVDANSLWQGNMTVTDMADVIISVSDTSEWRGNLVINADNPALSNSADRYVDIIESKWTGHIVDNGADVNVSLDDAKWQITGNSRVSALESYGSDSIIFHSLNPGRDYHTLTVDTLDGDVHFVMRAGYYGPGDYGNDKLIITGDKSISMIAPSSNTLTIINNGSDNTHGLETITMIETADGRDQFTATGDVELGGYVYSLEQSGNNWILRPGAKGGSWQPGISRPADAAANSINVNYLLTYAETQSLYQRMGDLRHSQTDGDVWVRGYYGGFNKFSGGLMNGFDMNYRGMQFGADKKIVLENGQLFLGAMFGMTNASQNYETGDGTTKSRHVGVYGSYLSSNGFYIDGLARYNQLKNDINVSDSMGAGVSGNGKSKGFTASLETGQRFHFRIDKEGFYLEPQLQFSVTKQDGDKLNLSNGLTVKVDDYTSLQGRAGILLGYAIQNGHTPANIYVKSSYVKEFDGKTHYALNGSQENHSFEDDWWVYGIGVSVKAFDNHNFYVDMERSTGDKFNQYQTNLGYRLSF